MKKTYNEPVTEIIEVERSEEVGCISFNLNSAKEIGGDVIFE